MRGGSMARPWMAADPLERETQMRRQDLMNRDLLSEIVLLGSGALLFGSLLLIVVTVLTQA